MGARFGRSRREPSLTESATPLDGLLEQMRDLRLTLAADLSAAASASEAGADDIAADIVEADRQELARFARAADARLLRLQRLATAGPEAPTWRRRVVVALPVVPVVGALALSAAAATGVLPLPGTHAAKAPAVAADHRSHGIATTFQQFADVVGSHPNASQVLAAAHKLHHQLARLIATSTTNPGQANEIARLLEMEQTLLLREEPPGASVVLDATRKLAARLVHVAPQLTSPTAVPTVRPSIAPSPQPSKKRAHTSPSPSPTPKASSSSKPPSGSPAPSNSPLPHLPN